MQTELEMINAEVPARGRMTHTECVAAAAQYMAKRYDVVLPEFFTHNAELPDVIAFKSSYSVVIECKISRGDFLADRKKSFRMRPEKGMGDYRFYCCPKDMIKAGELPTGWGLLYVYPNGKVRMAKDSFVPNPTDGPMGPRGWAGKFEKNKDAELHLLFYYARRANYAGVHRAVLDYRGIDGIH